MCDTDGPTGNGNSIVAVILTGEDCQHWTKEEAGLNGLGGECRQCLGMFFFYTGGKNVHLGKHISKYGCYRLEVE